jgi:Rho termination factor, N-terminal domain
MNTRFTVDQLERMKTHELADLLTNVVLVLRRLPDVECRELGSHLVQTEQEPAPTILQTEPQTQSQQPTKFTPTELEAKKVQEIRQLAKDFHLTVTSKSTKKELIPRILARQEQAYSDQFAIQHL